MAKSHNVTVFSTPTCPWCHKVKDHLKEKKVEYKDFDVSQDQQAAQKMVEKSGEMGVPQIWIDDEVVVGYDPRTIDHLLDL